jgi:GNAT superfamily N-acetyltransferase
MAKHESVPERNAEHGSIRRARRAECATLSGIDFRAKASWGYSDSFMAACREELTIAEDRVSRHDVFVLERACLLLGFYALVAQGEAEAELTELFVEPGHQGQGHGMRLMEHARATTHRQPPERNACYWKPRVCPCSSIPSTS